MRRALAFAVLVTATVSSCCRRLPCSYEPEHTAEDTQLRGPVPAGRSSLAGQVTRLRLPAAARVEIRFLRPLDDSRGPPWVYAPSEVPDSSGDALSATTTDAAGRFAFRELAVGIYGLSATGEGGLVADASAVLRVEGAMGEANLALEAALTLTGRITWSGGKPARGRVVLERQRVSVGAGVFDPEPFVSRSRGVWGWERGLAPGGPPHAFPLDADGVFRAAGLPPGEYRASPALDDGQIHGSVPVRLPTSEPVLLTLPVPARSLVGNVVDASTGAPIPGARVVAQWIVVPATRGGALTGASSPVTTDAAGRFALLVADPMWEVCAELAGYRRKCEWESKSPDGTTLSMTPLGRVEGRVLDARGAAVAGAVVRAGSNRMQTGAGHPAVSAADGTYAIEGVELGEVAVLVRGGGWASRDLVDARDDGWNPFLIDVHAGERVTADLVVEPAVSLSGHVLDEGGAPVEGALLRALGVAGTSGTLSAGEQRSRAGPDITASDAQGAFRFKDLVPGLVYEIEATAPGHPRVTTGRLRKPPDAASRAAGTDVVLRFTTARWVDAHVLWLDDGTPVAGAQTRLFSRRPLQAEWELSHDDDVATDGEGWARLGPVADGLLAVYVTGEGVAYRGEPWPVEGSEAGSGPFAVTIRVARRSERPPPNPSAPPKPGPTPPPKRTLEVTVLDPEGLPVNLATVTFVARRADAYASVMNGRASFPLEPAGEESVGRSLAEGGAYLVVGEVHGPEGGALPYRPAIVGPLAPDAQAIEIRLEPELAIEGQILDEEGRPLHGVLLRVEGRAPDPAARRMTVWATKARTGEDGRFRIGRLPPGAHRILIAVPPDFLAAEPVEAAADARDVSIRLRRGVTARIAVLDAAGEPVAGAKVSLHPEGPQHEWTRGVGWPETALDGVVHFRGLDPEEMLLVDVAPPPDREDLLEGHLPAAKPADRVARLERGVVIAGTVRDRQGRPPPFATVEVRVGGLSYRAVTSDGKFRFIRLPAGPAIVKAGGGALLWDNPTTPQVSVEAGAVDLVLTLK